MENICVVYQHIGYKRNPNVKNKLIIDAKVEHIVKMIYKMYYDGHGSSDILDYLTKCNYLSPRGYQKTGIVQDEELSKQYCWNETTILGILKNEVYIGNTVQHKRAVISYKIKKLHNIEKENQIRVNNTHEAIIDKEIFDKVNCILEKRGANSKLKYEYLLRGLLICHHCGKRLQIVLKSNSRENAIKRPYITCSNHKSCYPLCMNYNKFESSILNIIRQVCKIYVSKDDLYKVYENYNDKVIELKQKIKKRLDIINNNIFEIDADLEKMYMDKLNGILSEENYIIYSQKIIKQKEQLIIQKNELENEMSIDRDKKNNEEKIEKIIEDFMKFDNIDKTFLYRIIDRIELDKDKNIYIFFNFSKSNLIAQNISGLIDIDEIIKNKDLK